MDLDEALAYAERWGTAKGVDLDCAEAFNELVIAIKQKDGAIDELVRQLQFRRHDVDKLIASLARAEDECKVWMNAVADAVEPLGYSREAACGPADLLPGLDTLVELAGQR